MKEQSADEQIDIRSVDEIRTLLGPLDTNARLIRELHGVNVLVRDGGMRLLGKPEDVAVVRGLLARGLESIRAGGGITTGEMARRIRGEQPVEVGVAAVSAAPEGRRRAKRPSALRPRTPGQGDYLQALRSFDVVFGVGPAGTGKTYLAVAEAVAAFERGDVRRIVLVRPAVEAGEKLGFLPGDMQQKVDPYLRPLYDAIEDLVDPATRKQMVELEAIEVCPLAYMRGRTLNEAFVILDEAQNSTVPQMMMFLTRLGHGSRMVVTGDPDQVDLPANVASGLNDAIRRLRGVDGVSVQRLTAADVVRHPVVQRILRAYDDEPSAGS